MLEKIYKNSLNLLSLSIFFGGIFYYFYSLNIFSLSLIPILSIIAFIILNKVFSGKLSENIRRVNDFQLLKSFFRKKILTIAITKPHIGQEHILFLSYLVLAFFFFLSLHNKSTEQSMISPWQFAPHYIFLIYFSLSLLTLFSAITASKYFWLIAASHFFLTFSVALIIYKIGYGFDPFVHQAALELIDETGAIFPKTLYYSGYYSLIIFLHKTTWLPLKELNNLLVPISAALLLPAAFQIGAKDLFTEKKNLRLALLACLFLPLSFFVISTPQNFAYILLIVLVLLSLRKQDPRSLASLSILSLAIFFVHPLAGIPAVLFVSALLVDKYFKNNFKKTLLSLIIFLTIIILPLAFSLLQNSYEKNNFTMQNSGSEISVQQNTGWKKIFSQPFMDYFSRPNFPNQEKPLLNYIYFFAFNLPVLIVILLASGIFLAIKNQKKTEIHLWFSFVFFIAFFLTKFIPFDFLIAYERSDYANRILTLSLIFSLPFLIIAYGWAVEKTLRQNIFIRTTLFILSGLLATNAFYLAYPRLDNYFNARGYSTGEYDKKAVVWIDKNSIADYAVLSNQQVSAAALDEFGFKKYYADNIFFYPIPTGGPLYRIYLDMVYEHPTRANAEKAARLTGADQIYFVLNKYWWAFAKIRDEAELYSDESMQFGNGDVWVYKYSF